MPITLSTEVQIINQSGGPAMITLYYRQGTNNSATEFAPTSTATWWLNHGETSSPIDINYTSGSGASTAYWAVVMNIRQNATHTKLGVWVSALEDDPEPDDFYTAWQLQSGDSGKTLTFSVDCHQFHMTTSKGSTNVIMSQVGPLFTLAPISNVFVVMLENRSYDSMFAASGIQGLVTAELSSTPSTPGWTNPITGTTLPGNVLAYGGGAALGGVAAPESLATDPGHELPDVYMQLTQNTLTKFTAPYVYPAVNNGGFAANWQQKLGSSAGKDTTKLQQVMWPYQMQSQLPVLYTLATEFAVCDHWFSSVPGPTWPNRFFVHAASSDGLDQSPSKLQLIWSKIFSGYEFTNGTIFSALSGANNPIPWRIYADYEPGAAGSSHWSLYSNQPNKPNPEGGDYLQVTAIAGITSSNVASLASFAADLQRPYPYAYTFIEPNYGAVTGPYDFKGGSSQHPLDNAYGGEALIKAVYEAIRASPLWPTSLLIITYDEHGGLADSVLPPKATIPGDVWNDPGNNEYNFQFNQYGVRVPAVVVSPRIVKGTVDHNVYDHTSVIRTMWKCFGLPKSGLTARDKAANDLLGLIGINPVRTDCPMTLPVPAPASAMAMDRVTETVDPLAQSRRAEPLQTGGAVWSALLLAAKTHHDLEGSPETQAAITARLQGIKTYGDAQDYLAEVSGKMHDDRAARRARKAAAQRSRKGT